MLLHWPMVKLVPVSVDISRINVLSTLKISLLVTHKAN